MRCITDKLIRIAKKENSRISRRVLNLVRKDIFSVISQDKIFWLEAHGTQTIPAFAIDYVAKRMRGMGFEYLYDTIQRRIDHRLACGKSATPFNAFGV